MIVIVMGVSGSGKTTAGKLLAQSLHWDFQDADDFHPAANIEKMGRGIPLDDADRMPWLLQMQSAIAHWLETQKNVVLACSALKASYRDLLFGDSLGDSFASRTQIKLIYLKGDFELFSQRLQQRQNHYMKVCLLSSQFATLEEPQDVIVINAAQSPEAIVAQIVNNLKNSL
ncbi:MAG: gluconokinase [Oscillatoriaceae cyanobacterium Prado104]|jgi:gluconokinase|nr:gluconokinase [Oscillatoriaceae cyanobacterium Prado104]